MKIHRQLTATAFLFISMAIMAQVPFSKKEVKEKMKQVADWQISNPNTAHEHHDLDWTNGALYVGMADWAKLAEEEYNDSTYYQWLYKIGRRNCWQPHQRLYHADDITVSQSFIDLYRKYKKEEILAPTLARTEWIVNLPPTVHSNWSTVTTKPWNAGPGVTPCSWPPRFMPSYTAKPTTGNTSNSWTMNTGLPTNIYSIRKRTFSTETGIISAKKKPMAERCSGDVEMPGYWPDWQKYCRSCPKA